MGAAEGLPVFGGGVPLALQLLAGLVTAMAVAYAATPIAMRAAVRLQFFDRPLGYKGHAKPTPYLGGSAVVVAFVFVALVVAGHPERTWPVIAGTLLLWAIGTADDRVNLSPFLRLAIEVLVAGGLWAFGLGWELGFGGAVDLAVTALWIAGVVNAFNLFDNMDGAAGTMACVVSGAMAILGAVLGDAWLAVCGAALCGACLGFLPYNLSSPPRIFLGDGGSMPIGFVVASLVMIGASGAVREWQALAMALLLVGIPLLDTCLVVTSRRRRGLSILTGGRDHLTHRTRRRLTTVRAVAVALGAAQALLAVLALAAYRGGSVVLVIVVAAYVLVAALAIEILDAGFSDERAATEPEERRPASDRQQVVVAGLLGFAFGLSPFYDGGYNSSLWAPVGLVALALLLALAIGRPPRLSGPAKLALGTLAALGGWSLVSVLWSSSPGLGFVAANRMIVLAATLGVLLFVVRDNRSAIWALGGAVAGTVLVGVWSVGVMLLGDGVGLFVNGRLNGPLGYINAQGSVYGLAVFPMLSLAEWRGSPRLAALGASIGTLCLGLAVLSVSRGVIIALIAGGIVVILVGAGRLLRIAALSVMVAAVAAATPWLLDAYREGAAGPLAQDTVRTAAIVLLLASALAGAVWWLVAHLSISMDEDFRWAARSGWCTLLAVAAVTFVGVGIAKAPQIIERGSGAYHAFRDISSIPASSQLSQNRVLTGTGARYDYWRIAYLSWRERPLAGVGAGGYSLPYYQQRLTTESVRQPHSLQFQVLAELGLIGMLLLAACLASVLWGCLRAARCHGDELRRHLLIAASGLFAAWLAQTSVDWLHLMPGVTAVALVALAVLVRRDAAPQPVELLIRRPVAGTSRGRALAGISGLCILLGLVSLSRQTLGEHYRMRAQEHLAEAAPADALELANRSIRLDGDTVSAYYLRSMALAQLRRGEEARAALFDALDQEPKNFVTWALIGDLEARVGHAAAAQRAYQKASALNPLDVELSKLANGA